MLSPTWTLVFFFQNSLSSPKLSLPTSNFPYTPSKKPSYFPSKMVFSLVQWKLKNISYFPFLLILLEWISSHPIKIQGHPTLLSPTINFKMKTNGLDDFEATVFINILQIFLSMLITSSKFLFLNLNLPWLKSNFIWNIWLK